MAKINVFKDRNGNVIYQRPVLTPSTKKAEDLLKKTAQKAPKIDTSPRNYGKPVTEKVQIVDYQSPIDTSPRNYGRPLTNKPHFGLYDDEKSLSNVTLGDVTYKPLLSGYYGQKMNEAIGVNRLAGNTSMNTPQIAKYQGLTQKYEPTRFNNPNAPFGGVLNNAPQGAMSLIGQQVANLTDEDTVMYAGTGAAAGAMAGSVAGLPGSAITAATGFSAGIAAGVGKNMFEAVYGGTYRDLMDAGVSDSTAHKTALISAGVQSALEMAQLDELAKAAKLLRKQNKTVLAEGIEKILIDRGKGVLKNTAEEVAQEAVAMGFEYDAKKLEGLPTDSWQDNVNRAVETGLNSALSMGLISLPGAVSAGRQINSYNGKATSMDKAVGIANKIKRESDIKNPEFTGPFMQPQTAEPQIAQFTPDENVKNVLASKFKSTEDVKKWAENLAQKSKFDIEFIADADASYNGYFKPYASGESNGKQGRMVVNLHSEDPIKTVFGHELTHILEANSKEYNEYANFAINNLVNRHYGTADITALAEQKAASYAQRGVNLSIDEAKQEIVAELSGEYLFKDEQSITDLYRYNENLFYRIYENIKNMIKSFAGTDEEKDLIKARNLYAKVLKANQKNPGVVQTAQEGDTQVAASYLFAGERAANADKEALAKAQQMEAENADAETIWKETGWFRGPDKKWRWEIDDSKGEYYQGNAEPLTRLKAEKERYDELFDKLWNSELTKDEEQEMESLWELLKDNNIDPKETGAMGDFYKNDDMYAAYPNLKYVGVRNEKMDPNGMYIPDEDTIAISKDITDLGNKDRNKSVLLHETQHAVQRREGFAKGGNLDVAKQYINSAKNEYEQLSKQKDDIFNNMLDGMPEDTGLDSQGNVDDKLMAEAEKLFDEKYAEATSEITKRMQELENKFGKNIGTSQYDAYRNFAGEIEAREVQNRQNMTAQERREKLPDLGGDEAIVKFSLKEPVEKTKDLIAAHNLTIDNMMKTLDLGGLPAASIAVAKADMGHSEFGEISVLFYPDTIDGKKNKANKVFSGDAWTQTFPQISQKVSKQAHERLEKRINSLLAGDDNYKDLGYLNLSYDGVQGEIDRWDSFERAYRNSYLMKLAYLRDTGKEFKPVMMEKNFIEDKPVMKAMLQIIGADKAKERMDKDEMMSYEPKIRQAINNYYDSVSPGLTRYDEPMTWAEMDRILGSLRKYASYVENGSPKVIDTRKTEEKFDKAVNEKQYRKWLESISDGLIEKQGVRNSKDPYTNNGRRSWDQLYDEPTLENITKAMTSKDLTGNSFSGGTKFAAGVKKQLGSISEIRQNKGLIKDVSDEEIRAIRDDIDSRLIELVDTISGNNNDSLFARDGVIDSLLEIALKGKTRDGIKRRLMATQYGNIDKSKLTDKVVDDFVQLIQDAQAVPTRYFEAKPQRAIGLDEIAMVVIPRKGTKELRAALDARGISYKMYDGTAEDRIAKINGVPDIKFSLKKADDGDAYGEYDGDTSLVRTDVWEHTEPDDRSPYFEKGENPARDINVPQFDEYGRKVSRFTRTAAESRALDDNQASELNESVWNGTFSYNVITDQDAINKANDKMERFDNDTLLNGLESKLYDSKIITKDDIALGERLIQEYAQEKNTENLERAIAVVATAGTRAGQAVQAMRLLKKLSPAGQLMALQKQIDTINTDMKLLGDNKVTLSPERAKDITSSDTPEGLEQAVERAKMELYNKVPSRWVDKWNAWRYLSMLGNPKTHIRNMFSNVIFVPVKGMKNVIGATIEAATVKGERSKAIGKLPKALKDLAAKDFATNRDIVDAGGKENIERNKRVFKSSLLEGMRKANSFALEAEDQMFLKAAYVRSFAGYLKANKISPALAQKLMSGKGTDIEIGDAATAKIFNNARAYAMNEAQKATYRDYSALANALNKFKKTNAATTVLGEGLMPFTKTPINILKRGVEYSPVGILKGIKELANDVRKADEDMKQQTILKGIDSMASGLSGTAILALGAFLASQGILSGGGEEDKKERDMAAMMGSQNYSFNIGDVSYTVDWTAPVSLPLFVGVELFNSLESKTVNGFVDIVDAMTSISEPMVNMSMLQGLNRAVTNSDQKGALTSTATEMALGYFSQGVPTLGGQIARTMDDTRRTAYVDKNNDIPDTLERPLLNAAAKVPGLSKKLNPYRDSFGRAQRNDSTLMRAFENFISPGYVKIKKDDRVLSELQKVYGKTGDKGVLPSLPNKKIGDKDLTAKEYDRMAYIKGTESYELINDIRKSDAYKDLSASDQAKMINDVYSYAYAKAKDDVLGIKPDGWIAKAAEAEKKHDIPVETYISYNNYKNSLEGAGTKAKFIDKIQNDDSLTPEQKDKLDDYWYGSIEASKITELSTAEQRQWNVAKEYGFDEEKFSKYVGYITQQGEGKTKMNNINDAVKAGLPRGEAVLLYNIMRQKKYRYSG